MPNLHSTMYLLKHNLSQTNNCSALYLHSTMYLLKLRLSGIPTACLTKFTFHYVSIKTIFLTLHFLKVVLFTFHYVSIKTIRFYDVSLCNQDLHSTMYLLKLTVFVLLSKKLLHLHSTMYLLKL